jgi:predicted nucleotidyltransferase
MENPGDDCMDDSVLINEIVDRAKQVEGVGAIVLGGSCALGTHTEKSDVDLCFYYHPDRPMDLGALDRVAAELDDSHQPGKLTPVGGWGPWINGGGWLSIRSQPVDFLYRDLQKVESVIDACREGRVDIFYQPGHPFGFISSMYMAEVALCRPLWQTEGRLSVLKRKTHPYPPALKKALIQKFGWEIGFSLDTAKKSIDRMDVAYAAGGCFRGVMCMLQVLFALNERYWLNEKGAMAFADSFSIAPEKFRVRVEEAFALLAADAKAIEPAISILDGLQRDTMALAAGEYPGGM